MTIPSDKLGEVGRLADGRYFVRFERHVARPIETVWRAITDPAQLAVWFPEIRLDARAGGAFTIRFGGDCDGPAHVTGTVTEWAPPTTLALGDMRFELESTDEGCKIVFTDILHFERGTTPTGVTNAVLAGWHRFMDLLEAQLLGQTIDLDTEEPDYSVLNVEGRPPS